MFGIGFQELVLLSLIGLIVLGPERLPRVANQIGGWLGQARRMTRVMKRQLEEELDFDKDLNLKPGNREPSTQPKPGVPNADDRHSEAHAPGEPGTAIADTSDEEESSEDNYENADDLAVSTADRSEIETPVEDAVTDSEPVVAEEKVTKEVS